MPSRKRFLLMEGLLDAMGGEVWCESEPGEGATFVARFPKAKIKQKQLVTG